MLKLNGGRLIADSNRCAGRGWSIVTLVRGQTTGLDLSAGSVGGAYLSCQVLTLNGWGIPSGILPAA
jgi:hypothetical protein